jgi:hypothetical protein
MAGHFSINMDQMKRFKVFSDNLCIYENILNTGGKFFTINEQPYIDNLCEYGIFYTFNSTVNANLENDSSY